MTMLKGLALIAYDDIIICEFTIRCITRFFEVDIQDICFSSIRHPEISLACLTAGSRRRYSSIAREAIIVAFVAARIEINSWAVSGLWNQVQGRTICQTVDAEIVVQSEQASHPQTCIPHIVVRVNVAVWSH
jgi:hypothetical protein